MEKRKTGLSFTEALEEIKNGKKLKRIKESSIFWITEGMESFHKEYQIFSWNDVMSNDWEIVE